MLSIVVVI